MPEIRLPSLKAKHSRLWVILVVYQLRQYNMKMFHASINSKVNPELKGPSVKENAPIENECHAWL